MEVSAQLHDPPLLPVARNSNTHGLKAGWAGGRDSLEVLKRENLLPILGFKIQSIV